MDFLSGRCPSCAVAAFGRGRTEGELTWTKSSKLRQRSRAGWRRLLVLLVLSGFGVLGYIVRQLWIDHRELQRFVRSELVDLVSKIRDGLQPARDLLDERPCLRDREGGQRSGSASRTSSPIRTRSPARSNRRGRSKVPTRALPPPRPLPRRESAARRGYDRNWRRERETYLAANPLCVLCPASRPRGAGHGDRSHTRHAGQADQDSGTAATGSALQTVSRPKNSKRKPVSPGEPWALARCGSGKPGQAETPAKRKRTPDTGANAAPLPDTVNAAVRQNCRLGWTSRRRSGRDPRPAGGPPADRRSRPRRGERTATPGSNWPTPTRRSRRKASTSRRRKVTSACIRPC